MSKNVIVIYYDGCTPSQAMVERIGQLIIGGRDVSENSVVIKHYDEESIIKITSEDAIRKIVFDEKNEQQEVEKVKVFFNPGPSKLQVMKFIKEAFRLSLREAKDAVDNGVIMIPQTTDVYQFVRDLYANGGCIINGGDEQYAVAQAAIFIHGKYPGDMQAENFVKDFAIARYHDTVNAADNTEKALLHTVQIVKDHPDIAQKWIHPDLVRTITML